MADVSIDRPVGSGLLTPPAGQSSVEQFYSAWTNGTGAGATAVKDGGAWGSTDDYFPGSYSGLLSVVSASGLSYPGPGSNLLRIEVNGENAANIETLNVVPRGESMFVRFLIRFSAGNNVVGGNHFFVHDIFEYRGAYISPSSAGYTPGYWGMKFQCDSAGPVVLNAGNPYPYGNWSMVDGLLQQGVWYEVIYELRIIGTSETAAGPVGTGQPGSWPRSNAVEFRPHVSIYNTTDGSLVADENDMRCQDYGGNGVSISPHGQSWNLGQWNAAARNFVTGSPETETYTDQIDIFRRFSLGNNGQQGQGAGSGSDYIYIGDFGIYTGAAPALIGS